MRLPTRPPLLTYYLLNIMTMAEHMFSKCFQNDFDCYLKHFINVFVFTFALCRLVFCY